MPILTAKTTKVPFGFSEIDGLMDEQGNFYIAVPQIATLVSVAINQASRDFKALLEKYSTFNGYTKIKSDLHSQSVNSLTLDEFKSLLDILALRYGNPKAIDLLYSDTSVVSKIKKKRASNKSIEKEKQEKLAELLCGECEVNTLAGRIDILTSQEIIEVKSVAAWKSAIGQILIYGSYYPSHKKRIHLFGETQESYLSLIKQHCDELNITLTWER